MQGMDDTVPATGTHILIDHFGGKGLTDPDQIERALHDAARARTIQADDPPMMESNR